MGWFGRLLQLLLQAVAMMGQLGAFYRVGMKIHCFHLHIKVG